MLLSSKVISGNKLNLPRRLKSKLYKLLSFWEKLNKQQKTGLTTLALLALAMPIGLKVVQEEVRQRSKASVSSRISTANQYLYFSSTPVAAAGQPFTLNINLNSKRVSIASVQLVAYLPENPNLYSITDSALTINISSAALFNVVSNSVEYQPRQRRYKLNLGLTTKTPRTPIANANLVIASLNITPHINPTPNTSILLSPDKLKTKLIRHNTGGNLARNLPDYSIDFSPISTPSLSPSPTAGHAPGQTGMLLNNTGCESLNSSTTCTSLPGCVWTGGQTIDCSISFNPANCPNDCTYSPPISENCSKFNNNQSACKDTSGCSFAVETQCQDETKTVKCTPDDCMHLTCTYTSAVYGKCDCNNSFKSKSICEANNCNWDASYSSPASCTGNYLKTQKTCKDINVCKGTFQSGGSCSGTYQADGRCTGTPSPSPSPFPSLAPSPSSTGNPCIDSGNSCINQDVCRAENGSPLNLSGCQGLSVCCSLPPILPAPTPSNDNREFCNQSQKECLSTTQYRYCTTFGSWSSPISCGVNKVCNGGECIPANLCESAGHTCLRANICAVEGKSIQLSGCTNRNVCCEISKEPSPLPSAMTEEIERYNGYLYFSQRDERWANNSLEGRCSYKKWWQVACGPMVNLSLEKTFKNFSVTPEIIMQSFMGRFLANKSCLTGYGDNIAYLQQKGFKVDQYRGSTWKIPKYLENAAANKNSFFIGGEFKRGYETIEHFSLIVANGNEKNTVRLNDPYFGPDINCQIIDEGKLACEEGRLKVELQSVFLVNPYKL